MGTPTRFLGWLALALLIAGCGGGGGRQGALAPAAGRTLSVACFGGQIEHQARTLVGDVVESALGCEVEFELGTSREFLQRLRAAKGSAPPFDVVYLDGIIQEMAVREGLLEEIQESELRFFDDLTSNAWINRGYGPGIQFFSVGLAYNRDVFRRQGIPPPTSWADLWKLAGPLQGKLAIPDIIHSAGMDLFLVALELEGKSLDDADAIPAALERLKALKPAMVYRSSTEAAARLARGEIALTPTYSSRAFSQELEGAPVGWAMPREKGFGHVTAACVVKGSTNRDLALAYLNIATSPSVQLAQSLGAPFGPTNTVTFGVLGSYPEVSRRFPLGPSDMSQLRIPPWEEINKHRDAIEAAWREVFPDED